MCDKGCKTERWRVEESVERGLETLMSEQKTQLREDIRFFFFFNFNHLFFRI